MNIEPEIDSKSAPAPARNFTSHYGWLDSNRLKTFASWEDEIAHAVASGYKLVPPDYHLPHWTTAMSMGEAIPTIYVMRQAGNFDELRSSFDRPARDIAYPLFFREVVAPKKYALSGIQLIAAERTRQIEDEKWTPEHDDQHDSTELVEAATGYAQAAGEQVRGGCGWANEPENWPWMSEWWKVSADPIRNLVKAGALIAAEIDRLQRREASKEEAS